MGRFLNRMIDVNKKIDKIYFDFDSTLIKVESLDLLGARRGVGERVAEMTARSMNGEVRFADIFRKKMEVISPTLSDLEFVADGCVNRVVDGAKEVVNLLQLLGKEVYVLSANFSKMIMPVAKYLNILEERILANEIFFDNAGNYFNFSSGLLSQDEGKLKMLEERKKLGGYTALVGDSVSDLEAASAVDIFIGFGGVVEREKVKKEAEYFVGTASLLPVLNFLLTEKEKNMLIGLGYKKIIEQIRKLATTTTTGLDPVAW